MDASAFEQVYGAFQDFHAYFGPLFGRREARDHSHGATNNRLSPRRPRYQRKTPQWR